MLILCDVGCCLSGEIKLTVRAVPVYAPAHEAQDTNTNFFVIKPTRCTNFTNLFCHETLHFSDSSSVHHQEFIH